MLNKKYLIIFVFLISLAALIVIASPCTTDVDDLANFCIEDDCINDPGCGVPGCCCDAQTKTLVSSGDDKEDCMSKGDYLFLPMGWNGTLLDVDDCGDFCGQTFECTDYEFSCDSTCSGNLQRKHNEFFCSAGYCCEDLDITDKYQKCPAGEYCPDNYKYTYNGEEWCELGKCVQTGVNWCEHGCVYSASYSCSNWLTDLCELPGQQCCENPIKITNCSSANPDSIENIAVNHIKGEKYLNITWTNPCLDNTNATILTREPAFPAGNILLKNVNSYLDKEVEWRIKDCYQYHISYITNQGIESSQVSSIENVCPGDSLCEGHYGDEELCKNNLRYKCNNANRLVYADDYFDCSDSDIQDQFYGINYDTDYTCSGPNSTGKTICKPTRECEATGQPFGMYFDALACCSDYFCFFDYSNTIVDKCYNCTNKMSCFDYSSESACTADNCAVNKSSNSNCSWFNTIDELNKGYCYETNYSKEDYCGLCGSNDDPFLNVNCTQNACDILGDCYSTTDEIKCENCSNIQKNGGCTEYTTQQACEGSQTTSESNCDITDSDDSCSLGVCHWFGDTMGCRKDGDANWTNDCTSSNPTLCEKDINRPVSSYNLEQYYLNLVNTNINFSLYDGSSWANSFKLCLAGANENCCPSLDFTESTGPGIQGMGHNKFINIDIVDKFLDDITSAGVYNLRFYSIDNYLNREKTKNLLIYIDIEPPIIKFEKNIQDAGDVSDVIVQTFIQNGYADCSFTTNKYDYGGMKPIYYNSCPECTKTSTIFTLNYNGLSDGIYTITANCSDDFGNKAVNTTSFKTDAVKGIINVLPEGKHNTTSLTLSFSTYDDSNCTIRGNNFGKTLNFPLKHGTSVGDKYEYSLYLGNYLNNNGTYNININCTSYITQTPDSADVLFTIDQAPPATNLLNGDISGWQQSANVVFNCSDAKYDYPGEYGCKETYYCLGANCNDDWIPTMYIPSTTKTRSISMNNSFCYYSIDKGENEEDVKCNTLNIDSSAPFVEIFVENETVINADNLSIYISAEDNESKLKEIKYSLEDITNITLLVNLTTAANFSTPGTKTSKLPITRSDIDLIDGHDYKWYVSVINYAGGKTEKEQIISYIKDTDLDGVSDSNDNYPEDPCSIDTIGDNYGGQGCKFIKYNLTEPSFGVADNFTFDITVQTDKTASCRYSLGIAPGYDYMSLFDQSGDKIHRLLNFDEIKDEFDHYLYLRSDDGQIPPNRNKVGEIRISVDTTPPKFIDNTPKAEPNPVIERLPGAATPNTFLIVKTDDRTICKYDHNQTDYNLMKKFDGFDNFTFTKEHTKTLALPEEKGDYLYNFVCENAVSLKTGVMNISIGVYIGTNLTIIVNSPKPYMNITEFYLNISTNKHTECFYSPNSQDFDKFDNTNAQEHTQELLLNEGNYYYLVKCYREDDVLSNSISFTIDTTKPYIAYLDDDSLIANNTGESYYLDQLHVKWNAEDALSGVDYTEYKVASDGRGIAKDWTKAAAEFDGYITVPNLLDGVTYHIELKAKDKAGWWSEIRKSDGVTINKDALPEHCTNEIQDGGEAGFNCGGSCPPCQTSCSLDRDCVSGTHCINGTCIAPSCNDNIQDQDETDTDCGGLTCPKCDIGRKCNNNSDCKLDLCIAGVCSGIDLCDNDVVDEGETDTDCGGSVCDKCLVNQSCVIDSDCLSNYCRNETCAPKEEKDSDGDGMPDYWEIENNVCGLNPYEDDANEDADGDGTSNLEEYLAGTDPCDSATHPDIKDENNNGIPDFWDDKYCDGYCDPNADPDGDGLTNLQEYQHGTDPTKADTDGDGYNDKEEIMAGTNPLDSSDYPGKQKPKPAKEGLGAFGTFFLLLGIVAVLAGIYYLGVVYHYENYSFMAMGVLVAAAAVINYIYIESVWLATAISIVLIGGVGYTIYMQLVKVPLPKITIKPPIERPTAVKLSIKPVTHVETTKLKEELSKRKEELIRRREELFGKFEGKPAKKEIKKAPPLAKKVVKPVVKKIIKKPAKPKPPAKKEDVFDKLRELSKGIKKKEDIFKQLSRILPGIKGDIFEKLPKRKKEAIKQLKKLSKGKITKEKLIDSLRRIAKK